MSPPPVARLQDGARLRDGLQRGESVRQDGPLLRHVKRLSQRVAERVAQEERPRRPHFLCDLFQDADPHRRNSFGLDRPLDQAHGLIAQPSGGREDGGIGSIPFEQAGHLGRRLFHEGSEMGPVNVPHEPVNERADPANPFLRP